MTKQITLKDELTEFLLYTTSNGGIKIDTYLHKVIYKYLANNYHYKSYNDTKSKNICLQRFSYC